MHIPAFCDTCGAIFRSGFVVENATNITFSGNRSGPCPACGSMGHIPDGVFNFVGTTIEVLSAPQRTVDELSHLSKILREATEHTQSPEQVAETIRQQLPGLSALIELLPRTRAELYGFLALIIAVIALMTQGGDGEAPHITVNQTINYVLAEQDTVKPIESPQPHIKQSKRKVGRNEPCPCGSGKKYKKCCGLAR